MDYQYAPTVKPVIDYLSQTLTSHLARGERVLWLVSGGSNVAVATAVAKTLHNVPRGELFVSLADERFGSLEHDDENWKQLLEAGFDVAGATLYRPLIGKSRDLTTEAFDTWLGNQLTKADFSVGLLGVGSDGHTAGIKPRTVSTTAEDWATGFEGEDFERITMTFDAIKRLDEVIVQALGIDKTPVIVDLLHADIPLDEQPAQVLKLVKKCTLFTDYKESYS